MIPGVEGYVSRQKRSPELACHQLRSNILSPPLDTHLPLG